MFDNLFDRRKADVQTAMSPQEHLDEAIRVANSDNAGRDGNSETRNRDAQLHATLAVAKYLRQVSAQLEKLGASASDERLEP